MTGETVSMEVGQPAYVTDLVAAYDDDSVTELNVYNIGDGGAMSGILIAERRRDSGETTNLAVLLD